jgi:hypothetical protein
MSEIKICEANRFSNPVHIDDAEQMRILFGWVKWFAERNIRARLAQIKVAGVRHYAVYREGMTFTDDRVRCVKCHARVSKRRYIGNNEYLCETCGEDMLIWIGVGK